MDVKKWGAGTIICASSLSGRVSSAREGQSLHAHVPNLSGYLLQPFFQFRTFILYIASIIVKGATTHVF